jgi:membrane-bound metal-dependent hydrolase YbcI (DUF457 family)
MALPAAHISVAFGLARERDRITLLFLAVLSFLPDFDFILVWVFGMPAETMHRTWSHSAPFAVLLALIWPRVRPERLRRVSALLFFAVLMSHGLLDLLCTADVEDHGVMLFWPFSGWKLGWPVLVPLYQIFAEDPFSPSGAAWFTFVEILLAAPLWFAARTLRYAAEGASAILNPVQ